MNDSQEKARSLAKEVLDYIAKVRGGYNVDVNVDDFKFEDEGEKVKILTPVNLTNNEKSKAKKLAEEMIKKSDLDFEFSVDESLLDGLKIEFEDKSWDLSLKGEINSLSNKLLVEN